MRHPTSAIILSLVAAASHANSIPTGLPDMDARQKVHAIVVADLAAGADLPPFEECRKRDVICMHEPYWFRADILAVVSGSVPEMRLNVVTAGHQGVAAFVRGDPMPRLLEVFTQGDAATMPTYASRPLARRRDGELFLIDRGYGWPDWLPCATQALRETVDVKAFSTDLHVDPDEFDMPHITEHRDLYDVTKDGMYPRFGVAVSRLRELLASLKSSGAATDCRRPS